MKRTQSIWTRNNGPEWFDGRYDGEDFQIPPGEAIEMEVDCAKLVFGFGEPDKARAIRRLGWAPTHDDMPDAIERLNTFSFHMEPPAEGDAGVTTASSAPGGDTDPSDASSETSGGTDRTTGHEPEVRNSPLPKRAGRPSNLQRLEKAARAAG